MCWTFNIWTPPIIRATVWFWMQRCLTTKKNRETIRDEMKKKKKTDKKKNRDGAKFRFQICHAILWSADVHQKYVYGFGWLFEWCSFEILFWIFVLFTSWNKVLLKSYWRKYIKKTVLIRTVILHSFALIESFFHKYLLCFRLVRNVKWVVMT